MHKMLKTEDRRNRMNGNGNGHDHRLKHSRSRRYSVKDLRGPRTVAGFKAVALQLALMNPDHIAQILKEAKRFSGYQDGMILITNLKTLNELLPRTTSEALSKKLITGVFRKTRALNFDLPISSFNN